MAGPFKMKAGKEGPMQKNYGPILMNSPAKSVGLVKVAAKVAKKAKKFLINKNLIKNPKYGGKGYYNEYSGKYEKTKPKVSQGAGNYQGSDGGSIRNK
jgi:hypothetical protein